jgi:hypothetical protein
MAEVMAVSAELSGGYSIEQMDRLVRQLEPLIELDRPARVVIHLERLANVCPAALALLTAAIGGVAAAQGYPKKHKFEIAIVDLGVGIQRSLKKDPHHPVRARRPPVVG